MRRVAFMTLGCKVNQYDTQAMRELFMAHGYEETAFFRPSAATGSVGAEDAADAAGMTGPPVASAPADVYVINTCTVTGTGDHKSLKAIRRAHRQNPEAAIVVCGCLAQRDAQRVALPGVMLVLGTQRRAQVVELLERAVSLGDMICAVDDLGEAAFETLKVASHAERTRAVMKIQEGCDRGCAYCIIPSVRGPVRSMPLEEVGREARRLAEAGYVELVLTGIHLASYGRGMGLSLIDAVRAACDAPGVLRVRLGSLEPLTMTDAFLKALAALPKVCAHFHLSLQSGSDQVLRAMRRAYSAAQYAEALSRLRCVFPDCAITTDVIAGFPGETEASALETEAFVREAGFARLHVFPYSPREGTPAADMPGQVPEGEKVRRAQRLIALGGELEARYAAGFVGSSVSVLFETALENGLAEGYTPQYVRVRARGVPGQLTSVAITGVQGALLLGEDAL